jgi:16S rRNA (guanine527-N7)-methyltransferase
VSAAERLDALAARFRLAPPARTSLARILELLAADPNAPTTVRDPDSAVEVHVADSLTALELSCVADARAIADIGSGAGFPGAVLACALRRADVALVESSARKCAFLERLCEYAAIPGATVVHSRVEEWRAGTATRDLVVARALATLAVICEYAAPLLAVGGALVAWKGAVPEEEALAGARAAEALGLEAGEVVRTEPYAGSVAHHLHVYRKVRETPPGFPRRPGVAVRRPLGAAP